MMIEFTIVIFQKSVRDDLYSYLKKYDIRASRPADFRWSIEARAAKALRGELR